MKYLSVCSGIEAATVAWHHMGWKPIGFAEIEPFPSAILKHHYPTIPNYGDLTQYKQWPIERGSIDLLVSGTPCQAFSVAGLRQGLADPRGNLALIFLGLVDRLRPKYVLWENVVGVLSSNGGKDFASFIGALAKLRYGFAWRVCDAQFFGVPQRRKRVFLLAVEGVGNWRTAAEILFEPEGLCGNFEAGNKKGKSVAADAGAGVEADSEGIKLFENRPSDSRITGPHNISPTMTSRFGTGGGNIPLIQHQMPGSVAPTIGASGPPYSRTGNERVEAEALAITFQPGNLCRKAGADPSTTTTTTLKASSGDQMPHIATLMQVRRLTPKEYERLQGFPDDYSKIPWKNKSIDDCPDSPRYKAIGNSMAIPCMRWIGERINNYEKTCRGTRI